MSDRSYRDEVNAVQLPPSVVQVLSASRGQLFGEMSLPLDNAMRGVIFVIKSMLLQIDKEGKELEALRKELAELKKPKPKPTPKPKK